MQPYRHYHKLLEDQDAVSTIISVAELLRSEAEGEGDAKTSMNSFINMLKNAGLNINYEGLKAYYEADPRLQGQIQDFNEKEIVFVGDEEGLEMKPQGEAPPEEKVAQMAKSATDKRQNEAKDEGASQDEELTYVGEDTNQTYKDWEDKLKANREKAIAAGFVKPDGSADTRAHRASIAKQQDAKSAAANAKYWKENPKGKYEKIGNVTSMVMPPSLTDPKAEKANQAKIDKVWKDRTQAYKDKVKASGGKFAGDKLGAPGPRPIQATPTADDPKPWVRTKPMPRPWRKDQKPLPMGDVAVQYNKDNPNAAKSREQQIQIKQMARDEATRKDKFFGKTESVEENFDYWQSPENIAKLAGIKKK